jgi:hypothetical protein
VKTKLLFIVALAGCCLAGVAAASAMTDASDGTDDSSQPPTSSPAPGTSSVGGIARPNDGPPWTVLVWENDDGKLCATAGQLVNGTVGFQSSLDGKFRPYPLSDAPPCSSYDFLSPRTPISGAVSSQAHTAGGEVTAVWGLVDASVEHVVIHRASDNSRQTITPTDRGAFITAYRGHVLRDVFTIEALLDDGTTQTQVFDTRHRLTPQEWRELAAKQAHDTGPHDQHQHRP